MSSLDLNAVVASLEKDEPLHLARILLLLLAFRKDNGPAIEGITKLAKLDFLLRYPSYLERALVRRGLPANKVPIESHERLTIESQMVRFKFGPWDHRYRRFLNILSARALISISVEGRTIKIDPSELGIELATALSERPEFGLILGRAKLLQRYLDIGATRLMEFIYDTFPEIVSLELNASIPAQGEANDENLAQSS